MPNPSPDGVERNVSASGPARRPRDREHLTPKEVESLIETARKGRWGLRDATLILMCFSHGLRLSEALRLRWNHLDLDQGIIHLHRLKNGLGGDHRLRGVEIRALRRMRRQNRHPAGDYVFTSERGSPLALAPCSSCSTAPPSGQVSNISTFIRIVCGTPRGTT